MVGHMDDSRSRGCGFIGNVDLVVICKGVGHIGSNLSGEIIISVRGHELQLERRRVRFTRLIRLILPSGGAAMKAMAEIILRQVIFLAVKSKFTLVDTVGITSDCRPEI